MEECANFYHWGMNGLQFLGDELLNQVRTPKNIYKEASKNIESGTKVLLVGFSE